jgi:CDP-diacylglycerol--glycerol-3-phosphate 3-phosphatidyltransferase
MLKQIPNIITLGRFVLTVVFLVMLFNVPAEYDEGPVPFMGFLDIAFIIFLIAGLTDIVDGTIARKMGVASKFGRMMDPLADKVLVCGSFICFAIIGQPTFFDVGPDVLAVIHWGTVAVIIAREVYVTVVRQRAEARGINFAATASGKIKMFLQSFAIGTVVMKMAHIQTETWGNCVAASAYIAMLAMTIISGVLSTRRQS